eukprot:TRINITY_DN1222_c0_g3_i1.p1 TRINITY_DN1222_c0_g3~~TRINITY_DN1222_c0_g3_i1.p1  ORF type:complete len:378 (+),score=93.80 TRINITY_DN1222_c0_g3_i1:3-1136(+)
MTRLRQRERRRENRAKAREDLLAKQNAEKNAGAPSEIFVVDKSGVKRSVAVPYQDRMFITSDLAKKAAAATAATAATAGKLSRGAALSRITTAAARAKQSKPAGTYDIWENAAESIPKPIEDPTDGWLDPVQPIVSIKKTNYIPSTLPKLEMPTPGSSYRPREEDHMDDVCEIALDTARMERLVDKFSKVKAVQTFKKPIPDKYDFAEPNLQEIPSLAEPLKNKPKTPKRKTRAQRKNEKTHGLKLKMQKQKLEELKKEADIDKIDQHLKSIKSKMLRFQLKRRVNQIKKIENMSKVKRLSKNQFHENKTVLLPSELPRRLTSLPVNTTLIHDRFKSFQKRNIIVPSIPLGVRLKGAKCFFAKTDHTQLLKEIKNNL